MQWLYVVATGEEADYNYSDPQSRERGTFERDEGARRAHSKLSQGQ